jgi:hypothetical protein
MLIRFAGSPHDNPRIRGRTLIAKFDFFLRYPKYLIRANEIRMQEMSIEFSEYELENVETRMIRYRYGPWDDLYYEILAYLVAKNLVRIEVEDKIEYFGLTEQGTEVAAQLAQTASWQQIAIRAGMLRKLFPKWSGNKLKEFIYTNFPEVVSLQFGQEI